MRHTPHPAYPRIARHTLVAMALEREFFTTDPVSLAKALLGATLVRVVEGRRLAGRIVETEAYLGVQDLAAHSKGGHRSPRNESMYQHPGTAYVYFTYGMHHCFNIVCGEQRDPHEPVAVLVRALEPTEGLGQMRAHRAGPRRVATLRDRDLCSGPAKLCQALAIDREFDRADLVTSQALFVEAERPEPIASQIASADIGSGPRIGVAYAGAWAGKELRFFVRGNAHVSRSENRREAPP